MIVFSKVILIKYKLNFKQNWMKNRAYPFLLKSAIFQSHFNKK